MSGTKWAFAAVLAFVLTVLVVTGLGAEDAPLSPVAGSPEWARIQGYALPAGDAETMKAQAHKFLDLLIAGDIEAAELMLSRAALGSPIHQWLAPARHRIVSLVRMSDARPVSMEVAGIQAVVRVKDTRQGREGAEFTWAIDLYFVVADAKHLISFPLGGGVAHGELPTEPADTTFASHWHSWPGQAPTGAVWNDKLLNTWVIFSRQWPGWDEDPGRLWPSVAAFGDAQRAKFGEYSVENNLSKARFVGMAGGDAVVERDVFYNAADGGRSKVTYRFRMVRETAPKDPPEIKVHPLWRIADICAWRVEMLSSLCLPSEAQGGTTDPCVCGEGGGTAGGCNCGCGGATEVHQ